MSRGRCRSPRRQRRYSHRWKYDGRFGRVLAESWPNGVGRGFRYSSIGAVEAETGLGDEMPLVLREVKWVNALGQATEEWLGGTAGAGLRVQRTQTIATGELELIDYTRRVTGGATPTSIWTENYRYDGFGNLLRRAQRHDSGLFDQVEHYQYDLLHRMTQSSLTTNGATAVAVQYGYDIVGNLRLKSDFSHAGGYTYPSPSQARPNVVQTVDLGSTVGIRKYRYDASGNVVCHYVAAGSDCVTNAGFKAHYNHNQQPTHQIRATSASGTTTAAQSWFTYGADQQPARQWGLDRSDSCANHFRGCQPHHRIYLDRYEDTVGSFLRFDHQVGQYRTRAYVGDYLVATRGRYGELEMSFLLRDRLGSVVGVESVRLTNRSITAVVPETRHGFDAFGAPRDNWRWGSTAWVPLPDPWSNPTRTQQGFTGHERLNGLQLIHMKGRVFDPILGRFHGVDPIIQFPLSSQGLNPYSYILNNPMAGVDPTGYCVAQTGSRIRQCVTVTAVYENLDGSETRKQVAYFNANSDADRASGHAAITAFVSSPGFLGSNGAEPNFSVHVEGKVASSDIGAVSETRAERGDRITREVRGRDGGILLWGVVGSAGTGAVLAATVAGGAAALPAALPELRALLFSIRLMGGRHGAFFGETLMGDAIGGASLGSATGGMLIRGAPVTIMPIMSRWLWKTADSLDVYKVASNPRSLWGRSAQEIASSFGDEGFEATVRQSTLGSGRAQIVVIRGHPEIGQIQVHPGGGRHAGAYIKISTSTQGIIKVVDPSTYRPTSGERATIVSYMEE